MARLTLITGTDPRALLTTAAEDFLAPVVHGPDVFPSPASWLVLRQGGLRDDLIRLASARGIAGWFDPPVCVFSEFARTLAPDLPKAIDAIERLVVIEDVLRHRAPEILGRADRIALTVGETDALFGELSAEGIGAAELATRMAAVPERDAFQMRRDGEVIAAWQGYRELLTERGRRDGRDALALAAVEIAERPDTVRRALGGRRTLHIVGLMDLRGGWRRVLSALRAADVVDDVRIYSMHAGLLDGERAVRADDVQTIASGSSLAAALFRDPPAPTPPAIAVEHVVAADERRAIEGVATTVRALLDSGIAPHRVAVVAREARPFVDRAAFALTRCGVPVTTRQRIGVQELAAGRLVPQLLAAAAEQWSRHALVELAEHPYGLPDLDAGILNRLGYERRLVGLSAWDEALRQLIARATARDAGAAARDEDERRRPLPETSRLERAATALIAFRAVADALAELRTRVAWVRWLVDFLETDPWNVGARLREARGVSIATLRGDVLAWERVRATATAWLHALEPLPEGAAIDVAAFARDAELMLAGDVVLPTSTAHGVVVAEGLAAAYREFDHVFVIGLEAGRFPRRRPAGIVFDDREREALLQQGVPLDIRASWETRERELFRTLVASATVALTVVSAREDDAQQATVESSFVEALARAYPNGTLPTTVSRAMDVLTPTFPMASNEAAVATGAYGAAIERQRLRGDAGVYDGAIELPTMRDWLGARFAEAYQWSPTQIESLAKCPHQWWVRRVLGMEAAEDPSDDASAAVRGTVLHDALARFFDLLVAANSGPVLLDASQVDAAMPTLTVAFDAAYDAAATTQWMGHPSLEPLRRAEWRRTLERFVRAEAAERTEWLTTTRGNARFVLRTAVSQHEVRFGPIELEIDGLRFRVAGSIDRVEVGADDRIDDADAYRAIVDYKSSTSSLPGKGKTAAFDDGIVVQAPLYAMALEHAEPAAVMARIEYRVLRTGKSALSLGLVGVDPKAKAIEPDDQAAERYERSRMAIPAAIRRARGGAFPAEPAPSNGCPPFCPALDTCRIRGGPKLDSW